MGAQVVEQRLLHDAAFLQHRPLRVRGTHQRGACGDLVEARGRQDHLVCLLVFRQHRVRVLHGHGHRRLPLLPRLYQTGLHPELRQRRRGHVRRALRLRRRGLPRCAHQLIAGGVQHLGPHLAGHAEPAQASHRGDDRHRRVRLHRPLQRAHRRRHRPHRRELRLAHRPGVARTCLPTGAVRVAPAQACTRVVLLVVGSRFCWLRFICRTGVWSMVWQVSLLR
mmetsp:Transcript_54045/g.137008  ORF Transcript_54045/g.137008 Transcript_54045/m.137008 type:complete len:223 (-) Transcript_54045:418-1086(-)